MQYEYPVVYFRLRALAAPSESQSVCNLIQVSEARDEQK